MNGPWAGGYLLRFLAFFSAFAVVRMAEQARQGALMAEEEAGLEGDQRLSSFLGLVKSKPRRSLRAGCRRSPPLDRLLREQVSKRSDSCRECCRMTQDFTDATREIEPVTAEQHGGPTTREHLALACFHGNNLTRPNIAGNDPSTGQ